MGSDTTPCRIGLLIGEIEHPYSYQGQLLETARDHACRLGHTLVTFMGHGASTDRWGDFSHTGIYRFAGPALVDGLVVAQPVLSLLSPADFTRFVAELPPVPKVFLGRKAAGCSTINVDNRAGVRALMDHIILHHGWQRIACIRGPMDNQDARERYGEYCAGLNRHGIALDDSLVVDGNFTSASGYTAMAKLHATPGLLPQAVVAANDEMALGAMEYLHSQGLAVPECMAVFGFDDIRAGRDSSPPLSTIQQPITRLLPAAIDLLLLQIHGGTVEDQLLPTLFIPRESCGCQVSSGHDESGSLIRRFMHMAQDKNLLASGELRTTVLAQLDEMDPDPDELDQTASALLGKTGFPPDHTSTDPGCVDTEELHQALDLVVREMRNRARARRFAESSTQYAAMSEINLLIRQATTTRTLQEMRYLMDRDLPRLGIPSYSIACVPPQRDRQDSTDHESLGVLLGKSPSGCDRDDILLSLHPGSLQILAARAGSASPHDQGLNLACGTPCGQDSPTSPDWLAAMAGHNLLVMPLVTREYWLGVVIFPMTRENIFYCYGLHDLLANLLDREIRFRDLLEEGIRERSARLAQKSLIESLNSVVVGFAHEINTPVGIGITSSSFLKGRLENIRLLQSQGGLKREDFSQFLNDADTTLDLMDNSLRKISDLMNRFRNLAMDLTDSPAGTLDLTSVLGSILDKFRQTLPRRDLVIVQDLQELPPVETRIAHLALVLGSILENAGKHAYPPPKSGRICLAARIENDSVLIQIQDWGQGMSPDTCENIFRPFKVMRREGGGMGIGMHIAWTLAAYKLSGNLSCQSSQGEGTTFSLRIPLTLNL